MIKRLLLLVLLLQIPSASFAQGSDVKAAFIRDGNVWLLQYGKQEQITNLGKSFAPSWSYDGEWLMYQRETESENGMKQNEIWIYNVRTKEQRKIFHDGYNPQWRPNAHEIAFQSQKVLNISNLREFRNVALGVDSYTWLPDGSGFLLSANAALKPDGWTNPVLYKKKLGDPAGDVRLFEHVTRFFTLPKELKTGERTVVSIQPSMYSFSPSGAWISFAVSPTASMAMDDNMICVIRKDGTGFEALGEAALETLMPKWAPRQDTLAYISGSGRIVFGFKNKKLEVKEFPASGTLTPASYAELSFAWLDDETIITSRVKESEWSNIASQNPHPALYKIEKENQVRITNPPKGVGDYEPQYVPGLNKIIWLRTPSLFGKGDIWIANPDGTEAKMWLKGAESVVFCKP